MCTPVQKTWANPTGKALFKASQLEGYSIPSGAYFNMANGTYSNNGRNRFERNQPAPAATNTLASQATASTPAPQASTAEQKNGAQLSYPFGTTPTPLVNSFIGNNAPAGQSNKSGYRVVG
jgi:hypothetical protein